MLAAIFFDSYLPRALRRALQYAGDDGFVASMPQLLHVRVNADYDNIIWNTWFNANSEENLVATKQGNRCTGKVWPADRIKEKVLYRRIYWTPTRVSRSLILGGPINPMRVGFTFKISTEGKVEDIELVSLKGDITEAGLLKLINDGAKRTRFEPLVIAEKAYEIVGVRDEYILDDF